MVTKKHWLEVVLDILSIFGKIFRAIVRVFRKKPKKDE